MNEEMSDLTINHQAILSLVFGILTILSCCTGMVPFMGVICFPLSVLFGFLALVFGVIPLNGIRGLNQSGSPMAWIGIVLGGLIFLCVMCMVAAIASFFIFTPDAVPMPPFIQNFSI